tara:strand:- start:99 stop:857 length:759 start_codon:yes stop_codon:yes gene_type:complete
MIFENLIKTNLRTQTYGRVIEYYQMIDSTNKEAKALIENNEANHGMIIISDNQKDGKGRSNNSWFMSPGKGLAMSLIHLKPLSLDEASLMPLAAGLAVAKSLKNRGLNPKLKWPNDIFINNKKVGGILCESKIKDGMVDSFIIGIGININESPVDFPDEIKNIATSLFIESGYSFQRELICAIITTYLERVIEDLGSVIEGWLTYCNHLNKRVEFKYNNRKHAGIFQGINKDGLAKILIDTKIAELPSIIIK